MLKQSLYITAYHVWLVFFFKSFSPFNLLNLRPHLWVYTSPASLCLFPAFNYLPGYLTEEKQQHCLKGSRDICEEKECDHSGQEFGPIRELPWVVPLSFSYTASTGCADKALPRGVRTHTYADTHVTNTRTKHVLLKHCVLLSPL